MNETTLRETIVFINPDLLKSEAGFDALKDYFSNNIPSDFTMVQEIVDGKLVCKPLLEQSGQRLGNCRVTADYYAITGGYFKTSLNSIRNFLGIS